MNTRNAAMLTVILLAVAGCIPTLNPIYRSEDLVFDPALIGEWRQPDSDEKWQFTKRDNKSYGLTYTDEQGQHGRFIAHLANIQGQRFLDLYPDEEKPDINGFYKFHLVPIHTVYLVRQTEPKVELAAVDYPWLDDYLAEHPRAIEHVTFGGRTLITATTDQLQAFVLKHLDSFTARMELERATSNGE